MSTKKVTNKFRTRNVVNPLTQDEVLDILKQLQAKVLASSALNGGFDTLLYKVDKIEEKQEQVCDKVESIHTAIYSPDDGLYARVKDVEVIKEKAVLVEQLEKDILKLQQWQNLEEKSLEKEEKINDEYSKLMRIYADQLKELMHFKNKSLEILKWLFFTIGGSIIGGSGKLIYDFLHSHIVLQ